MIPKFLEKNLPVFSFIAILSALILLLSNSMVPNHASAITLEEQEGFPNLVLVLTSTNSQQDKQFNFR